MSYHEVRCGTKLSTFAVWLWICTHAPRLRIPCSTVSTVHQQFMNGFVVMQHDYRELVLIEHNNY